MSKEEMPILKEILKKIHISKDQFKKAGEVIGRINMLKVKTRYTKGGDWTALSLFGYGKKPTDILKPGVLKSSKVSSDLVWTSLADLKELKPLVDFVTDLPCAVERVRFMKLRANKIIGRHTDKIDKELGYGLGKIVRLHLPIVSNAKVVFSVFKSTRDKEGITDSLKVGSLYYLDATKPHAVSNFSDQDRIHLVIDCYLNEELKGILENNDRAWQS